MDKQRAERVGMCWRRRTIGGLLVMTLVAPLGSGGTPPVAGAAARAEPRPYNASIVMNAEAPAVRGNVVTDGKVVAWAGADGALFAYALADARETRLLDGPARREQLVLDNGVLVWVERGPAGAQIRGLRFDGGGAFTIAAGPGERNSPAIGGRTVVWRDRRGGNWDLYVYDLEERREFPLTQTAANEGAVVLSGTTIVWEDRRSGRWLLTGFDLAARREFPIGAGPDEETGPALAGGALVFTRRRAGQSAGALILRDLASGTERTLVEGHLALNPTIDGDLVAWEDWRDGMPNVYAYDRVSTRVFPLTRVEGGRDPAVAGAIVAWLSRGEFSSRVTAVRLVKPLPSDPQDPPAVADPNTRYFPESRHNVSGAFRYFWALNGGLDLFGLPLTEAFEETDAKGTKRQVQYFERVKLEADPADPSRITIARLGAEVSAGRHFPTVEPFESEEAADGRYYFPQTQHSLSGWFRQYWEANGGVAVFGFPISEEVRENGRVVQYFERARFELRPESTDPRFRVALGQLGREALVARGWLPADSAGGRP